MNCALNLNGTKRQWIDLDNHTEACMTVPETCSAAGGAISVWVRVDDCTGFCGMVSSEGHGTSGMRLYGTDEDFEYDFYISFFL